MGLIDLRGISLSNIDLVFVAFHGGRLLRVLPQEVRRPPFTKLLYTQQCVRGRACVYGNRGGIS
jgi:hypothetical protein